MRLDQRKKCVLPRYQGGFTLVEMITVIVITGILASFAAMTLSGPVQQYLAGGLRADMTSIADTSMRFIIRDLRTALPYSVRVTNQSNGSSCNATDTCYLEFIPIIGEGRYRLYDPTGGQSSTCGAINTNTLTAGSTCFDVLGTMPTLGSYIIVDNASSSDASSIYSLSTAALIDQAKTTATGATVYLSSAMPLFTASPGDRFQIISTAVSYVCDPSAGILMRYSGYAPTNPQPTTTLATTPAELANHVSACNFSVASGLVTLPLTISETDSAGNVEKLSVSGSAYVDNQP